MRPLRLRDVASISDTALGFMCRGVPCVTVNGGRVRGSFGDVYRMQDADSARLADEPADHMAAAMRCHARSATVEAINTRLSRPIPQPTNMRRLLQSNQYLAGVRLNAPDGIVFLDAQGASISGMTAR